MNLKLKEGLKAYFASFRSEISAEGYAVIEAIDFLEDNHVPWALVVNSPEFTTGRMSLAGMIIRLRKDNEFNHAQLQSIFTVAFINIYEICDPFWWILAVIFLESPKLKTVVLKS